MEDVYDASTDDSDSASVDSEIEDVEDFPIDGLSISREEADRWYMFCSEASAAIFLSSAY